ncbi:non-structural transmembrane glycoprotein [Adelaide River virus]|uniref:Non-structural glycoprotein n=2 Tax=Adelaide River virus TaxID=31612 RepID=VGLN_ARV|nr:non-structural transmembrane glycoprotein [Adelaide River virus]Q89904.1 RecName: Full=Non-structural glycoprotein; Flags: Precursor [Adelaide River virus]AAA02763.1 ARV Gns protein [Adelaide River virus]AAA02765.1 ARV Gns protein [Adelaide River virus]AFR23536.1 non-structural transmembrane glycoprotein [Adelaide River virus]
MDFLRQCTLIQVMILAITIRLTHGGWTNFPESCVQLQPENAYDEMCDDSSLTNSNSIEYHNKLKSTKKFCILNQIKSVKTNLYRCYNISITSVCNSELSSQNLHQDYEVNPISRRDCLKHIIKNWNDENLERSLIQKSEDIYRTRCNFLKNTETKIEDYIIYQEKTESSVINADGLDSMIETKLIELESNKKLDNTVKTCISWEQGGDSRFNTLNLIALDLNLCLAKNSYKLEKCLLCYFFIGQDKWYRGEDGFMISIELSELDTKSIPKCEILWYRLYPGNLLTINQDYLAKKVQERNRGCNAVKSILRSGKAPPLENMIKYTIPLQAGYGIGFREKIEKTVYSAPLRGNLVERRNYDFFRCHYFPSKIKIVENKTHTPPINLCVYHFGKGSCHYPDNKYFISMNPVSFEENQHYPKSGQSFDYQSGLNGIRKKIKNQEYYIPDSFLMTLIYSSHTKSILEKTNITEVFRNDSNYENHTLQDYLGLFNKEDEGMRPERDLINLPNITSETEDDDTSDLNLELNKNLINKTSSGFSNDNSNVINIPSKEYNKTDIKTVGKINKTSIIINHEEKDYWHEEYNMWGLSGLSFLLLLALFYNKIKRKIKRKS